MNQLFVRKEGKGSIPLVMLHGWGTSSVVFEPLLPLLSNQFEIFLVDLPGFGKSPWVDGLTLEKMANMVLAAIDKPAIYLGWSLGSQVALSAVHQAQEKALAYINVAGSPAFCQSFWPYGLTIKGYTHFLENIKLTPEQVRKDFIDLHFRNSGSATELKLKLAEKINALPADPAALIATTIWLGEVDLRPEWQVLTLPTLSILGEKDILLPNAEAYRLHDLNPKTHKNIVKNASHMLFLDNMVLFSKLLTQFVADYVS